MSFKDLNVILSPARVCPNSFEVTRDVVISFEISEAAQQDGHGPFPTFEDHVDKTLKEAKNEIMNKQKNGDVALESMVQYLSENLIVRRVMEDGMCGPIHELRLRDLHGNWKTISSWS